MRLSIALLFCLLLTTAGIMRGAGSGTISGTLVSNEQWPRSTDLVTWTTDVMRIEGLEHASETAQGKKFFEWLRLFCRMAVGGMIQAYEGDYGKEKYVTDAHKNLFVYGWGYCDTCSRIADAAWKEYKRDRLAAQRVVVQHPEGGYHTMYRLRLDGHYGAFDPRYGYYLIDRDAPDARVLDWAEVGVDANITKNLGYKNRSKPFFEIAGIEWKRALDLQPVFFESETAWRKAGAPKESVFENSQYQMGTRFHDMAFRVPRGTTIERFWDNSARQFYVPAGKHTQRQRITGDMQTNGFESGNRSASGHLRAVDHGDRDGFVVRQLGDYAVFIKERSNCFERIKDAGYGRTRITGKKVNPTFHLKGTLHEQFIPREDFEPCLFHEARVILHVNNCPKGSKPRPKP